MSKDRPIDGVTSGIIYEYEDGGRYCGEWSDNLAHGHGICTGPQNEGLFEGRWEKGNQVSGVYSWSSGQKYFGQWKNGYRHGSGKEVMPDGTEYVGDFTNDHRDGFGVVRRSCGDVYRGSWKGGLQNGEGLEEYVDGGIYRGEFKDGMRHGYGTRCSLAYEHQHTSASVRRDSQSPNHVGSQAYSGQWQYNKRHGYGALEVPGSFTYYGEWKENARTGYGVLVHKDGVKEEGEWQNGLLVVVLKRGKVSLLHLKLESKVKQAHTMALQAMKTAGSRVTVAESRAASAQSRSQVGSQEARVAQKDALLAQERSQLHANAPVIPEVIKSPVQEVPMDIASTPVAYNNLLSVTSTALSTSFENLAMLPSERKVFTIPNDEVDGEISLEGSIRSNSSCDSEGPVDSLSFTVPSEYSTPSIFIEPSGSPKIPRCASESNVLRHRHGDMKRPSLYVLSEGKPLFPNDDAQRTDCIDHTTGESLPEIDEKEEDRRRKEALPQEKKVVPQEKGVLPQEKEVLPQEKGVLPQEKGVLPQEKEVLPQEKGVLPQEKAMGDKQLPVQHNNGANTDVLMQIAMWNRSMTYLNLILLVVLLALIVVLVISLYYVITPAHLQGRPEDNFFQPLAP